MKRGYYASYDENSKFESLISKPCIYFALYKKKKKIAIFEQFYGVCIFFLWHINPK